MPVQPDWAPDLDIPGSRFALRAALGVPIGEGESGGKSAEEAIREALGDWALEEQDEIGRGEAVEGSAGRGASAWLPVIEFVAVNAAAGTIAAAAGLAFKNVWQRTKEALASSGGRGSPYVSRGGAAALAVAHVVERLGAEDALEFEGVEEPSAIEGREVTELSYVGLEPWIVLLRDRERRVRFVVIVGADGEILGVLETPMSEFEVLFLPPPGE